MDKKIKIILIILNYLTKKFKSQPVTLGVYEDILTKLNFPEQAKNKRLLKFYNDNVHEGVNWSEFDLSVLSYRLVDMIRAIHHEDKSFSPEELFGNDSSFSLGDSSREKNCVIVFNYKDIDFTFRYSYEDLYCKLLDQHEHELSTYWGAKYNGDCYRPDSDDSDNEGYIFTLLDMENLGMLKDIMFSLGKNKIATHIGQLISYNNGLNLRNDSTILAEIVETFRLVFGQKTLDNMFQYYADAVNSAACDSVIEEFLNNLPDGVTVPDSHTITVTYDFFIQFLEEHPQIETFSDLKNYHFVGSGVDLDNALYDYNLDVDSLNQDLKYQIFEPLVSEIESNESYTDIANSIKDFEKMIKDLKFELDKDYVLEIRNKENKLIYKFVIDPDDVNYREKKLDLLIVDYRPNGESNMHRIPFGELPKYVTMEKLFESILSKLK